MRHARLWIGTVAVVVWTACIAAAAEAPRPAAVAARPMALHRPAVMNRPHRSRAPHADPPAAAPPATAPAEALPSTGPSGEQALEALRNPSDVQKDPRREWLLLVYLSGDNDIEEDAWTSLKQLEIGLPDSGVEVIALLDCAIRKLDDGYVTHPILYRVRKSKGPQQYDSEILKDLGPIDMADPKVLAAFIEGAVKTFPAQQHALFTWDHGGGWSGLLEDNGAPGKPDNHDSMSLPSLRAGLTAGMKAVHLQKWDILTFDMCLMGQLEVAAEVHDLADIMIASEDLEPGTGFPYVRVLELLGKGTLGGRRIGADIVQEYEKFHTADGDRSSTLSAFDLSLFDDVNARLNALVDKLIPTMPAGWTKLSKSFYYAEQYGETGGDYGRTIRQSVDLLDALRKCRAATPDFPAEAEYKDLVRAMDRFVIASATSRRRQMSNGLAIYAPLIRKSYDADYEKLQFFKLSHWPALLQSVFVEQDKSNEPPKFNKIELVDSQDRPIDAMTALTGSGISMEVEGKDIIYVRTFSSIHDAALGGERFYSTGYVLDRNLARKLAEGVDKFGQDVDLLMPQLVDGRNVLRNPKSGVRLGLFNGQTRVEASIDASNLSDTEHFSIPVLIEHPSYGSKPVAAQLRADLKNFAVTSVLLLDPAGNNPGKEIVPPAEARILPQFWLRKGEDYKFISRDALTWNQGLSLTVDLLPAGDYEDSFVARTMTGVETTVGFKYRIVENETARNALKSWKSFKSEMLIGTWQVRYCPIPAQEIDAHITMDVWPTEDPLVYRVRGTSIDAAGKEKASDGTLTFELHDLPFYRLVFDAVGNNPSTVLMGTIAWAPRDDRGCVLSHTLGLEQNYVWLQAGAGAGPGPIPRDKPLPAGWRTISDTRESISIVVPSGFAPDETLVQESRKIFDGYDSASTDPNLNATIGIIRFDGTTETDPVTKALVAGFKQKGVILDTGDTYDTQVDGVATAFYAAGLSKGADDKNPLTVALYLIPTARGTAVVFFECPAEKFEGLAPTMWKIVGTARVAK